MSKIKLYLFLLFLLCFVSTAFSATRVFFENCEYTGYGTHFMERYYGTTDSAYWTEMITEMVRSSTHHSGSYSMTYNPYATGNPHAVCGYGYATYGNTTDLDFSSYSSRYWYFRWYQRWQTGINYSGSASNKLLYLNYIDQPSSFVLMFQKTGAAGFHVEIKHCSPDYNYIDAGSSGGDGDAYLSHSGGSLDDEEWHKFEILIDVGTTGGSNGKLKAIIDDITLNEWVGVNLNATIPANPIIYFTGWPSNMSGSGFVGTCNTWLDDLEVFTLSSYTDIPADPYGGGTPSVPNLTGVVIIGGTIQ